MTLEDDLTRIYGLGLFESVRYTLLSDAGQTTLLISAVPKPWGPTYLSVGLSMETDFATTTSFGLTALVEATELNRLGGEWKTTLTVGMPFDFETRFYQPLSYGGGLFLSPFAGWQLYNVEFWNTAGTRTVETTQFSRPFGGLDIGYDFGNSAELRVGYLRASQDDTVLVGGVVTHETDQGALTAQLRIDRLDDVSLPKSGYFLGVDYAANRTEYGGSSDYDWFSARAGAAGTIGRWTGNLQLEYDSSFDTKLPPVDRFALGGLFRLSGRPIRNLRGEDLVLAVGQLYYRLAGTGEGFIKNFSVGGSLETGNAWPLGDDISYSDLESAGSIFLITETIVGPFFLGYGRSGDFDSFYLYLNRSF
jgi:NTE family protein